MQFAEELASFFPILIDHIVTSMYFEMKSKRFAKFYDGLLKCLVLYVELGQFSIITSWLISLTMNDN